MRRRNRTMSAAGIGLLLLVGGSSLVLYALVAQHLSPAATLDRPHVRGMAATSPGSGRQKGAGQSSPSPVIPRNPSSTTRTHGIASTAAAGNMTVAVLFTPATRMPTFSDLSPDGASTPVPSPVPSASSIVPSPVPPTLPSPGAPEPLPTSPPSPAEPPVGVLPPSHGCGHANGHRLHVPLGSANPNATNANGHVLHPCKSKGHGNVPEPKTDPQSHDAFARGSGDETVARHQPRRIDRPDGSAARSHRDHKKSRQETSGTTDSPGKGHAGKRPPVSHSADRPDSKRGHRRTNHDEKKTRHDSSSHDHSASTSKKHGSDHGSDSSSGHGKKK